MGRNAHAVFKANKGALQNTLKAAVSLIDPPQTAADPVCTDKEPHAGLE
jgi:hypothetical protein